MALLNRGEVAFQGSPDVLMDRAKGHVRQIHAADHELDLLKEKYPVVSTSPSEDGWDVQVVADRLDGYAGEPIEPTLEHAYVYFMEYRLHEAWNGYDTGAQR